ncbi:MAG: hypothetical protein KAT76_06760 [Bacteroidales bacterium]|nr:hypothetical protein [Bacteroidales bacterium]
MKRYVKGILTLLLFLSILVVSAQQEKKARNWTLNGHLQSLGTVWVQDWDGTWQTMNQIKNRFDFRWYPANFSVHVGMRNNFTYGMMPRLYYPYMADLAVSDPGYLDMTRLIGKDTSYYMTSNFDRFNIRYSNGDFQATVGRQRINWGINYVWNPNDIFNTFDYFDFDYVERPGCDAVHLQYYTGATSSVEAAIKIDSRDKITLAGMYRFNKWNYDFQFLGGYMTGDYVLGAGWSGNIKGAGFNGEMSYFHPEENFSDTCGVLVGSLGVNYTFRNSLMLQFSGLYNSDGTTGPAGMGAGFFVYKEVSAKTFTLAKYLLFGNISYPVTPLFTASLASMYNPGDKSVFVGPTFDVSITSNIEFMITAQLFFGDQETEFGDYGKLAYGRLKWNF